MIAGVIPPIRYNSANEDLLVVLDSEWTATPSEPSPPVTAVVGGLRVREDGTVGPFEPNPQYVPLDDAAPSDPTDAVLRRIVAGERLAEELLISVAHSIVEVACDTLDQPAVVDAPDGRTCVIITTAAVQKIGISAPRWHALLGSRLADFVPVEADILINPVGVAPLRLRADRLNRY